MDHITLIVQDVTGIDYDIEAPTDITARELIQGLHTGLQHGGACPLAMRAENPTAFLMGNRTLTQYQLRDGSRLYFIEKDERG